MNGLVYDVPDEEISYVSKLDEEGNTILDTEGNEVKEKVVKTLDTTTKAVKTSVMYMKGMKALQETIFKVEEQQALIESLQEQIEELKNN